METSSTKVKDRKEVVLKALGFKPPTEENVLGAEDNYWMWTNKYFTAIQVEIYEDGRYEIIGPSSVFVLRGDNEDSLAEHISEMLCYTMGILSDEEVGIGVEDVGDNQVST
jgi:hypothetical protein